MGSPLHAQIICVDISPVVHMSGKEGGDHSHGLHIWYLVKSEKLRVYHNRTNIRGKRLSFRGGSFLESTDILSAGSIPVAVGQDLHVFLLSTAHKGADLLICVYRISPVSLFFRP